MLVVLFLSITTIRRGYTVKANRVLYRVQAPHFVAGFTTESCKVVDSGPILKWTRGMYISKVFKFCKKKGWKLNAIHWEQYEKN